MTAVADKDVTVTLSSLPEAIRAHLKRRGPVAADVHEAADTTFDLLGAGLLAAPLPGGGQTLARWNALAEVAAHDLAVGRLVEGHFEAEAILAEADLPMLDGLWNVWAANAPDGRLTATQVDGKWHLSGTKRWCSGARSVTHALVTARDEHGVRLFHVSVRQAGVRFDPNSWPAVGMALSDTLTMTVERLILPAGAEIGAPGWYSERPGFWVGATAVAATWFGGALGLARALRAAASQQEADPFALVHLGYIDGLCVAMEATLERAANVVDNGDTEQWRMMAWQTRGAIEHLASAVLQRAATALGSTALCLDPVVARRVADLTVYLRQHGADREYAALASDVLDSGRRQ